MSVDWQTVARVAGGHPVRAATLDNGRGLQARVMSYGATLLGLLVPDRRGRQHDVVLGFDAPAAYFEPHPYFGAVIGRYANRIAGARFALEQDEYVLVANDGPNHLHGGLRGFDKVLWTLAGERGDSRPEVSWRYVSAAGEEGYPGKFEVQVTYSLTDDNALRIDYAAMCDAPTIVNLTHHAYWNLAPDHEDILAHDLQILGSRFLPVDKSLIPTGELRSVRNTAMDFRTTNAVGSRLRAVDAQLKYANGGYDHCWVLDRQTAGLEVAARLADPVSGRVMEVWTTQPGLQFYSGNLLDGTLHGKQGRDYAKYAGLCLETQHFPDSPHHPEFPSTLLQPGDSYRHTTLYKFFAAG
jgi:aldose 1-epimerase